MKKGQIVKCVAAKPVCGNETPYLTEGKEYTIASGEADFDWEGDLILTDTAFEILDDTGELQYCIYPNCAHATWELVSE